MRNQDDGGAEIRTDAVNQFKNLRLHRDVKRSCRLVGNEQFWIAGQGDGNHHTLTHATAELVRVRIDALGSSRNANLFQQGKRALVGFVFIQFEMNAQRFANLVADGHGGIEAGQRVLKDHPNFAATHLAHLPLR